jgi:hypothetical protein
MKQQQAAVELVEDEPAREMPNTQANATGSLPERIATFSPAAIPDRASPRANR